VSEGAIISLFGILFAAQIAQTAAVFWRLGKVEKMAMCPWGKCPGFEKAKAELTIPGS
jgi:hypothetical protein